MTIFYLDQEGGNDANAGTSFALRWKTYASGATAARIAPGDIIRVMASPDETLVGNVTWTNGSKTLVLPSAVTYTVNECERLWTASANVTCTIDSSTAKLGTVSCKAAIAAGFTTGLAAYSAFPPTLTDSASVGAHRYWRVLISTNNGDATYCNFGELELIGSNSFDQTGTGTATADSAQNSSAWPVSNLFDNNLSNFFAFGTGATYPHWVAYDFGLGVTKEILRITMTSGVAGGGTAAQQPKDFEIQYSDDGSTWTTSWSQSGVTGWTAETRTFTRPTVSETTNPVDLSAYQQLSFWVLNSAAIADAATLSLRLCSDAAGATSVHTFPIPAIPSANLWVPVTVDLGSAMSTTVRSIALYCDKDPGAININLDNIIACKASSSADALSLTSLIGKVWNRCWSASTTYAANDIRKPTQPNRNGFRYKVTAGGGGSSGSSEPSWPLVVGSTVTDGALTWTCEGVEEGWYTIQSIDGTSVLIDTAYVGTGGSTYQGTTETVATYKRECIKHDAMIAQSFNTSSINIIQDSGSADLPITFSGGWNRTDMSTQTGETWTTGQNGNGQAFYASSRNELIVENLNAVRYRTGLTISQSGTSTVRLKNIQTASCGTGISGAGTFVVAGLVALNCNSHGINFNNDPAAVDGRCIRVHGTTGNFPQTGLALWTRTRLSYIDAKANSSYGVSFPSSVNQNSLLSYLTTAGNGTAVGVGPSAALKNFVFSEASPFSTLTPNRYYWAYSHNHGGVEGSHYLLTDGATIISATDQRHTASGLAWKFRITSTTRNSSYPLTLPLAKVVCSAGVAKTVTIWTRRDSTNVKGALRLIGGQIAGVTDTVSVACEPAINTWVQSSSLTFTPAEAGVVEIVFEVWDGVGTTNNYWIDDLSIS